MDSYTNDTQVFSGECRRDSGDILSHAKWTVRELVLTVEKLKYVWEECKRSRSLFSDLTAGRAGNFMSLISDPDTFWMEVVETESQQLVGLIYLTEMHLMTECGVHIMFFDNKVTEKAPLCREVAKWIFAHFPVQRLNASIPSSYFVPLRLARKIGFVEEGSKRKCLLIKHRWHDETQLGLLRGEV